MNNKQWWKSKTVWTAVLGMIGALILTFAGEGQYRAWVALEAPIMTILTVIFRWTATTRLKK